MNRTWGIARQELLSNFKRRSYLLMTFGIPLLAILVVVGVMIFQANDTDEPSDPLEDLMPDKPIGYIDNSKLFSSPGMFGSFLVQYKDEVAARTDLEAEEIGSYYVVPREYMETGQVIRYSPQFNIVESDMALFESFLLASLLEGDSPQLLERLESPATVIEHQLDQSGETLTEFEGDNFSNFGVVYGFALIMMFSTFFTSNQVMRSVITEKENRAIEVVLSSVRPLQLLSGKVIGQGAAGLLQILMWLGGIAVILQITDSDIPFIGPVEISPQLFAVAILYYLGGYLLFAAFSCGIGAVSTNMREGPQYAVFYTLPAVVPLIFMPQILEAPNSTLAVGLSLFPMCSPLGMIERMVITTVPIWQIGLSLIILFASVIGALWLSARLFRVSTLLSGQVPNRQELIQLLLKG